jgi:hypothetical protein
VIVLGTVIILIYNSQAKKRPESPYFEKPYLRNGGIGVVLFGVYYLLRYFVG